MIEADLRRIYLKAEKSEEHGELAGHVNNIRSYVKEILILRREEKNLL